MADAWSTFTASLAGDLLRLRFNDVIIFDVSEDAFVQVAQEQAVLHLEARPAPGDEAALGALGWAGPEPVHGDMWFHDVPMPDDRDRYEAAARLIVTTLRDVHGAASPGELAVRGFNVHGEGTVEVTSVGFAGRGPDSADLNPVLAVARTAYAAADDLRYADLNLVDVAAAVVREREVPAGRVVVLTGGPGGSDWDPYQDRIVYVPPPGERIVVFAEAMEGARPGFRLATDPEDPDGPNAWAEQGTTPYLRHLLADDPNVAAALADDPEAAAAVRRYLGGGSVPVQYVALEVAPDGRMKATDFILG